MDVNAMMNGTQGAINYERMVQRMGMELAQAAIRIYTLADQLEALQADNARLTAALEEARRQPAA